MNFVQSFFWSNAGFDCLRKIKVLDDYEPRYDPTVIPIEDHGSKSTTRSSPSGSSRPYEGKAPANRYYTVSDYHNLYISGKLTPTAVAEALLPLIRRDVAIKGEHSVAFLDSKVDIIRRQAEASTLRYKECKSLGLLDGVPVAVKDEVDVDGYRKTLGSSKDYTPTEGGTSWCVVQWQEAGAIMMGKLNMHELGLDTTNNNPTTGTPPNPFNAQYYTGGSSGGSAYVVSTGLMPITLGADGGGSIRIPSSYCGVYGLKPSHGRISDLPSIGIAGTTGVVGPIAGTMEDLEIAYRVMATPDPASLCSSLFPIPRALSTPRTNKTLAIDGTWLARSSSSVRVLFDAALQYYVTQHSYRVVDITIPFLPEGQTAHAMTILSEIANAVHNDLSSLQPANKILIGVGSKTPADDFLQAQKVRNLLMQHLAAIFRANPGIIIMTPTTPDPGWAIAQPGDLRVGVSDGNTSIRSMEYVWLANFAGVPSLSVPMGYVAPATGKGDGMVPVGLMSMGEWGAEEDLIEWGREAEVFLNEHYEGGRLRPGKWTDVIALAQKST